MRFLGLAVLVAIIATMRAGAGGGSPASAGPSIDRTAQMQSFLAEASEAAAEYSRTHLGHYLQMRAGQLVKGGLEIPAGVSVVLQTGHDGYCLKATDSALAAQDDWKVGTASFVELTIGEEIEVSDSDGCPKLKY
ncbi:MAG: hypothetical protein H0U53_04740 [Actinobacteria bacterium]|nr:hypothetical protein [Actinomycetota bacterium]